VRKDVSMIQEYVGYAFSRGELLEEALTHSSYANEFPGRGQSNERLEFLGDAVLELCITEELFSRYPDADEGRLTMYRATLVNERALANLALDVGLDKTLLLGRGEEAQGGRRRSALLSDAFEALLGAIFLDGGYLAAREWVLNRFERLWPGIQAVQTDKKDYKTRLQEFTQQQFKDRPTYVLEDTTGPEHERIFHVLLRLPAGEEFRSQGTSVKKAEQQAAHNALRFLVQQSKK